MPAPVLRRLKRVLKIGRIENHGEPDDFRWVAEGLPALERVLDLVGPWLGSVKREQARESIAAFTHQIRTRGGPTRCNRGHEYDAVVRRRNGTLRKRCNTCARLRDRRHRAALGIAPRQFKDLARRYTE